MNELLPCPLCESPAVYHPDRMQILGDMRRGVRCSNFGCAGNAGWTLESIWQSRLAIPVLADQFTASLKAEREKYDNLLEAAMQLVYSYAHATPVDDWQAELQNFATFIGYEDTRTQ